MAVAAKFVSSFGLVLAKVDDTEHLYGKRYVVHLGEFVFPITSLKCPGKGVNQCDLWKLGVCVGNGFALVVNHSTQECGCTCPSLLMLSNWSLREFFKDLGNSPKENVFPLLQRTLIVFIRNWLRITAPTDPHFAESGSVELLQPLFGSRSLDFLGLCAMGSGYLIVPLMGKALVLPKMFAIDAHALKWKGFSKDTNVSDYKKKFTQSLDKFVDDFFSIRDF